MSLYREPRRTSATRAVLAGAVALLVLAAGFGIGRATASSASLQERVADVRADAGVVADALELVPIHYQSANATTKQGARDQLARARKRFAEIEPQLALLDARHTATASRKLEELERLVTRAASPAAVETTSNHARAAVRDAAGLR